MIITRTPFRISFVGGGSDLPDFYEKHSGAVISVTCNKYMYISSHQYFEKDKIRLKYSTTEDVKDINKIKHPIFREILKKFETSGALEISSIADILSGTGLGSSSSFTVGLLHNMYTREGKYISKQKLAEEACDIEINRLGDPIGKQDQYAASFGGLNLMRFEKTGNVCVEPIHLSKDTFKELEKNLLMFYIGNQRSASSILSEQKKHMKNNDKVRTMNKLVDLVWGFRDALYSGELYKAGEILHQGWLLKKELASGISNKNIDKYYNTAINNGAIGGKLLGAGGGGFLLFYCERDKHSMLRKALTELREFNFRFDTEGSKIVYIGDEYNE